MLPGTSFDRFDVEHCDECVYGILDCICRCTDCDRTRFDCRQHGTCPIPIGRPYVGDNGVAYPVPPLRELVGVHVRAVAEQQRNQRQEEPR